MNTSHTGNAAGNRSIQKRKRKKLIFQTLRLLVQIVFFIFIPAFYYSAFAGVKTIFLAVVHQNATVAGLLPQIIATIAVFPFTILIGRFFCGWMCAFGALGDFIYRISGKLFKIKFRMNEKADRVLKYLKYVWLVILAGVIWTLGLTVFQTFNPWDAFGMLATVGKTPDFGYVVTNLTAAFLFFCAIVVASAFIERFFCRYLCPLGALFALASKLRITRISKPRLKCGNCRICTQSCSMGIPLYKTDKDCSGECIYCLKCVSACPRGNVRVTAAGSDLRPLVASTVAAAAMTGVYFMGSFAVDAAGITSSASTASQASSQSLYKDGTYEGSGTGFRGGTTTVSVTIKNGKITNVTTVSTQDDEQFYSRAFPTVSQSIITAQSAQVNAVSGATYSSSGIMEAVSNALSNAKNSSASSASSSSPSASSGAAAQSSSAAAGTSSSDSSASKTVASASSAADSSSAAASSSAYKDGTYEGSGTGFRGGTTTVSVTVKSGKITNVSTVSTGDDRQFYSRAFPTVSQSILTAQSANVDAVSGATYSSRGIMEAVANALAKAK